MDQLAARVAANSPYRMVDTMVGPMAVLDDGLLLVESWHRRAADTIARDVVGGSTAGRAAFGPAGFLEPGVHRMTTTEFMADFAWNEHRAVLGHELLDRIPTLGEAGITDALIGGSYVTTKPNPGDLDVGILPRPGGSLSAEYLTLGDDASQHVSIHDARMFVRDALELGRLPGQPYALFLQANNRIPGSGAVGVPVGTVHLPLASAEVDAARELLLDRHGPRSGLALVEAATDAAPGTFARLLSRFRRG